MESQNNTHIKEYIEHLEFKIAEKNEQTKTDIMNILHEYPEQFIHGVFEALVDADYATSDIIVAYDGERVVGCLMFDRASNEFNWLAVEKDVKVPKSEIAKKLFETVYSTLPQGTEVHLYVNTEDAHYPGYPDFSGKNFERARNFYRSSMGLEINEENREENKYGPGAHAYKVAWVPHQ